MNVFHNKLTKRRIFVSVGRALQALRSWHSTCCLHHTPSQFDKAT